MYRFHFSLIVRSIVRLSGFLTANTPGNKTNHALLKRTAEVKELCIGRKKLLSMVFGFHNLSWIKFKNHLNEIKCVKKGTALNIEQNILYVCSVLFNSICLFFIHMLIIEYSSELFEKYFFHHHFHQLFLKKYPSR